MYIKRNTNKIAKMLSLDQRTFRTSDLSVLWGITNTNTLLTTISRFIKNGILHRIKKGVYSTIPINKLDPYEYGCAYAGPLSYITAETVLFNSGVINQSVTAITMCGVKSMEFYLGDTRYLCRYLAPKYLNNRLGIKDNGHYAMANPARAIVDKRHLKPTYYFDNPQLAHINNEEEVYARAQS